MIVGKTDVKCDETNGGLPIRFYTIMIGHNAYKATPLQCCMKCLFLETMSIEYNCIIVRV